MVPEGLLRRPPHLLGVKLEKVDADDLAGSLPEQMAAGPVDVDDPFGLRVGDEDRIRGLLEDRPHLDFAVGEGFERLVALHKQVMVLHRPVHRPDHLVIGKRLGEVVVNPFSESVNRGFHRSVAGDENDHRPRPFGLNSVDDFKPVHVRHDNIQDDHRVAHTGHPVQGRPATGYGIADIAVPMQHRFQIVQNQLLIIDDQDAWRIIHRGVSGEFIRHSV